MPSGPKLIPARLLITASDGEAWGRLLELNAAGAVLSTQFRLFKGDTLSAAFEAAGERFEITAVVTHCQRDSDGYWLADLDWTDPVYKRKLARALADLLTRLH